MVMSWASVTLSVVVVVNLFVFLGCLIPEECSGEVNSPILALFDAIISGNWNINWLAIFSWEKLLYIGVITGIIVGINTLLSPATTVTGSYVTVHVLTLIGLCLFISFFLLPDFGMMGIPQPVSGVISVIFGFMAVMSVIEILRGNA